MLSHDNVSSAVLEMPSQTFNFFLVLSPEMNIYCVTQDLIQLYVKDNSLTMQLNGLPSLNKVACLHVLTYTLYLPSIAEHEHLYLVKGLCFHQAVFLLLWLLLFFFSLSLTLWFPGVFST